MEDLLNELKNHITLKKNAKESLSSEFFINIGFTNMELSEREMDKFGISADFIDGWKKLDGNNEIVVIYHVKSPKSLIMPKADEAHVYLITRDVKTDKEMVEEFTWNERSSPLTKEELL